MRAFTKQTLSIALGTFIGLRVLPKIVGLIGLVVFGVVAYYWPETTPQSRPPEVQARTNPVVAQARARQDCTKTHPTPKRIATARDGDSVQYLRKLRPDLPWAAYDRALAARQKCIAAAVRRGP